MLSDDPLKNKKDAHGFYPAQEFVAYKNWCRSLDRNFTVFFFNICNIKKINEKYGWDIGSSFIEESISLVKEFFDSDKAKIFKTFGDKLHVIRLECGQKKSKARGY